MSSTNFYFPQPVFGQGSYTWPIHKTASYKTIVQPTLNNRAELRISQTLYPLWVYDLDMSYMLGGLMNPGSFAQTFVQFYNSMQGAASDWLFRDPFDFSTDTQFTLNNTDFESSTSTPPFNWNIGTLGLSTCTTSYETANPFIGNRSLVITATIHNGGVTMAQVIPAIAGQTFQLYGALKSTSGDQANINLSFFSSSNTLLGSAAITSTSSTWGSKSAQGTAPANTSFAVLQCFMSGASGGTGEFDAIQVFLINPMNIGTGDGSTKVFPITITYPNGGFDLMQNFPFGPNIYVNSSLQSTGSYSVDQFGNLTFTTAPSSGQGIAWSGIYDRRCRFMDDELSELMLTFTNVWECSSVKFKTVLA